MRTTLLILLTVLTSFLLATENQTTPSSWANIKPYQAEIEQEKNFEVDFDKARNLGKMQPTRFLNVDPMADDYPGIAPYVYTLNNPLIYVDPTGMWVVDYDEEGNIVNAVAEDDDNLESLYSQLGVSAENFAKQYNIKDMSKFAVVGGETQFDITRFVLKNTNFSEDNTMMNCFSSSLTGTGALGEEIPIHGGFKFTESAQEVFGFQKVANPSTGTMTTWVDQKGVTHHSAVYALASQKGVQYYVGRPGPNSNIAVQTSTRNNQIYHHFQRNNLIYPFTKPKF